MNLTRAHPDDAQAIAAAHALAFDAPWSTDDFLRLLASPGVFGFLAADEAPLGMILCRTVVDQMEVLTVGVSPPARAQGLGRILMEAVLEAGRQAGAVEVFLEVATDNAAAVALYDRLGFRRTSTRRAYYDRGPQGTADALVMHLDLAPGRP